jgi:N-acetylneuraminic acid mutarotase
MGPRIEVLHLVHTRSALSSLAVLVLFAALAPTARADTWTTLPTLAEARYGAAAAGTGGSLMLIGGHGDSELATASVWSNTTQSWSDANPMSQTRSFAAAATIGSLVYAFGGFGPTGMPDMSAERFDPATGLWSAVASMPTSRAAMGAVGIGGSAFVAGGETEGGTLVPECFRFDAVANTWTFIGLLPTPRSGVAAAALGGKVWVMGGRDGVPLAAVEVFNPAAGTWSVGPSLPEPLWLAGAGTIGDRVWIVGGFDAAFMRSPRAYSAGADGVWRPEADLSEALAAMGAGVVGTCLVVAGGVDATGQASPAAYAQCVAAPPPPPPDTALAVTVVLSPDHLNGTSNGNWITAHITADGWPATDIDIQSLRLAGVPPDGANSVLDDGSIYVKFSRAPFADLAPGDHQLELLGGLADGRAIKGMAFLNVKGTSDGNRARKPNGVHQHTLAATSAASGQGSTISFSLAEDNDVNLDVVDLMGRRVATLASGFTPAGSYQVTWPASPGSVPAGVYFVRMRSAGEQSAVRVSVFR